MLAQSGIEQIEGYAEWRQGDLGSVLLGYEVNAEGVRRNDGVIEATQDPSSARSLCS